MEQAKLAEKITRVRSIRGATGVLGVAATVATAVRRRAVSHALPSSEHPDDPSRWLTVSVNLTYDESRPFELPEPLRSWGEAIEVRTAPAPGDRGTELAVRLRQPHAEALPPEVPEELARELDGTTPVQKLRSALRRSKQLLETGELLRADEPGTAEPTALNAPLRAATAASGAEGRL